MNLKRGITAVAIWVAATLMSFTESPAHEFWIALDEGKVAPGGAINADLKVGQMLQGEPYPYLSSYFETFDLVVGQSSVSIEGSEGDIPALKQSDAKAGLNIITHQTIPFRVTYDDWAIFRKYLSDEGLDDFAKFHAARGLPKSGFSERYTRYAKALVQVGPAGRDDIDRPRGMLFELVAGNNPYAPGATHLEVQLFWQGEPASARQINIFRENADAGAYTSGTATRTIVITDKDGRARIPLGTAGEYLLNAVFLEPVDNAPVVWSSHWATLSFKL